MTALAIYLVVAVAVSFAALRATGPEPPLLGDEVPTPAVYAAGVIGAGLIWPLLLVIVVAGRLRGRS